MPLRVGFLLAMLGSPAFASTGPADGTPGPGVLEASACARCHANAVTATAMRDGAGRGIAPFDLWGSSVMAGAARDPFWRAQVAAEVAATPSHGAEIEATCLRCHAPMAAQVGLEEHGTDSLMHFLDCEGRGTSLGLDGVSCTICHGITPEGLGEETSFSGGFELDAERRLFGPHAAPFQHPMRMHTGFTPTEGAQIGDSALCGSCHTLFTHPLDPDGGDGDVAFPEQTPYLEWRNSDLSGERSCQDCHVPTTDVDGHPVQTRIAHNPGGRDWRGLQERRPFGRHVFAGANTLLLELLGDREATLDATRRMLREAARVEIVEVERSGDELRLRTRVVNRTGHKLPTGHPSRRVWLRVVVRDADGRAVVASGAADGRGRIVGGDGQPLPSELRDGPLVPHRDLVRGPDEVALYHGVMEDTSGAPTFRLMRAARWRIDDRLLPRGWRADHPDATATRPYGVDGDASFVDGSDEVDHRMPVPAEGPLEVEVTLLHQTLSARWADELFADDAPEVEHFRQQYDAADLAPEVLARAVTEVR